MKIEVRFRGIQASDAVREHVARRVHFQLDRFRGELSSVIVRIGDINGPRGGADKRCQVAVRGPGFGVVVLDALSADTYAAIDQALDRVARTVVRELGRTRSGRRPDRAA